MTDIIEQLRVEADILRDQYHHLLAVTAPAQNAMREAANEIAQLRADLMIAGEKFAEVLDENERLKSEIENLRVWITELNAAIRESPTQRDGWQSIETAPDDKPVVVGWAGTYLDPYPAYREGNLWGTLTSQFTFEPFESQPTHWRQNFDPPALIADKRDA